MTAISSSATRKRPLSGTTENQQRNQSGERKKMNEPIQEKSPKPPGLLPKHVQSWLILGIALLMIVIMWLTGGKKQQTAAKANAPAHQTPLPVEVNETKIADLQN